MLTRLILLLALFLGSATASHAFQVDEDENFVYIIKPRKDIWENKTAVNKLSDSTEKFLGDAIRKIQTGNLVPPTTKEPSLSRVSTRKTKTSTILKDYDKNNYGPKVLTSLMDKMNKLVAERRNKNASMNSGFGGFLSDLVNIFNPSLANDDKLKAHLGAEYKKTRGNSIASMMPDSVMVYGGASALNLKLFTDKIKLSGNMSLGLNLMPMQITAISKRTGEVIDTQNKLKASPIFWAGPDVKMASTATGLADFRVGVMPIWANHKTAYFKPGQFYGLGASYSKDVKVPVINKLNLKIGGVTTSKISSAVDFTVASLSYNIKGQNKDFGRINATGYMPLDVILSAVQDRAEKSAQKKASKVLATALEDLISSVEESPELDLDLSSEDSESLEQ